MKEKPEIRDQRTSKQQSCDTERKAGKFRFQDVKSRDFFVRHLQYVLNFVFSIIANEFLDILSP